MSGDSALIGSHGAFADRDSRRIGQAVVGACCRLLDTDGRGFVALQRRRSRSGRTAVLRSNHRSFIHRTRHRIRHGIVGTSRYRTAIDGPSVIAAGIVVLYRKRNSGVTTHRSRFDNRLQRRLGVCLRGRTRRRSTAVTRSRYRSVVGGTDHRHGNGIGVGRLRSATAHRPGVCVGFAGRGRVGDGEHHGLVASGIRHHHRLVGGNDISLRLGTRQRRAAVVGSHHRRRILTVFGRVGHRVGIGHRHRCSIDRPSVAVVRIVIAQFEGHRMVATGIGCHNRRGRRGFLGQRRHGPFATANTRRIDHFGVIIARSRRHKRSARTHRSSSRRRRVPRHRSSRGQGRSHRQSRPCTTGTIAVARHRRRGGNRTAAFASDRGKIRNRINIAIVIGRTRRSAIGHIRRIGDNHPVGDSRLVGGDDRFGLLMLRRLAHRRPGVATVGRALPQIIGARRIIGRFLPVKQHLHRD